ncbi:hypothetical protein H5410_014692 [Solanum commersonii]|uniref:Uncharacterized protein n=1 Tax=Solanum commersonii TaxID=4109 RepID=A0A9J5ZS60_SOLCO|nr:hypothetical protein H5410_014692 [Solanum commersonii]
MYLFIALRPLMRGFEFCKPVVVVDGSHLSGAYKGTFVSASTLDGADVRVKKYLEEAGYERWSRSHATMNRGRMMTSNIAECINGCLVEARQLPVGLFRLRAFVRRKESRTKGWKEGFYLISVYEGGIRYIVCLERKIVLW